MANAGAYTARTEPNIQAAVRAAGYDIIQLLGEGGMGVVYEAIDRALGQRVALKVLLSDQGASVYDFKHEFRALADVTHHNLVTFYELRQAADLWLLSMELVEGMHFRDHVQTSASLDKASYTGDQMTLIEPASSDPNTIQLTAEQLAQRDRIAQSTRQPLHCSLNVARLRPALAQLCDALHALHGSGHIHRDVKPSNIMVTASGRVVVLDFGIVAAMAARRPAHERIKGTPQYMAPEQADHQRALTPAADWYAVGVILYELLVGKPPFYGSPEQLLIAKHRPAAPIPAATQVPAQLQALAQLADELLHPDPAERPGYDEIRQRLDARPRTSVPPASTRRPTFIGRKQEMAALMSAYHTMRTGERVGVLLSGDSGMGKSMLVRIFLQSLPERTVTLIGRCYELENVPYKALDSLIDALSDYLQRLPPKQLQALLPADLAPLLATFPVLGRVQGLAPSQHATSLPAPPRDQQRRAIVSLTQLINRIAAHHPLVIVIDDLQFGDIESLPFLAELFSPHGSALLAIATHRRDATKHNPLVRSFRSLCGETLRHYPLAPLSDDEARTLCHHWLGPGERDGEIDDLIAEAEGNPHLLEGLSLLVAQRGESIAQQGESVAQSRHLSLHDVVAARCEQLSIVAHKLLDVVSVAGWRLPLRLATQAEGLADADLPRALSELRTRRFIKLVEVDGERCVETYHDSIREAIVAQLTVTEQQLVHTRLAIALDDDGDWAARHPFALANHYYCGEHAGVEDRVVALNLQAGMRAADTASFQHAYTHFSHVLEVAEKAGLEIDRQAISMAAEVCLQTGRDAEAGTHFERLLQTSTNPLEQAQIRLGCALTQIGRHNPHAAKREVTWGIAAIGQPFPRHLLGQIRYTLSMVADGALTLLRPPPAKPDSSAELERLRMLSALYLEHGHLSYFEQNRWGMASGVLCALSPVSRLGPSRELVHWAAYAATACATAGFKSGARRLLDIAAKHATQLDDPLATARLQVFAALVTHFVGDPVEAERELERVIKEHARLHNADLFNALGTLCWSLMMRGHVRRVPQLLQLGTDRETLATATLAITEQAQTRGPSYRSYAGPVQATLGQIEAGREAMTQFAQAVDLQESDRFRAAMYLAQKLLFHLEAGELGDEAEETMALYDRLALSPRSVAFSVKGAYVARAYIRLRQLEASPSDSKLEALQQAAQALNKTSRHPILQTHNLIVQAGLHLHRRQYDNSRHALSRASHLAHQIDNAWALYEIQLLYAQLFQRQSTQTAASRASQRAQELASMHGWPLRLSRATTIHERLQ